MLKELDTYDWKEAFSFATNIRAAVPTDPISLSPFSREDVVSIAFSEEGENDGPPWRMIGKLSDGRWFYLEAGCDYTGWDCQASGSAAVAHNIQTIIQFGCSESAREVFDIKL